MVWNGFDIDWEEFGVCVEVGCIALILRCLYVAFVVFALMNVVTGVFVENALKSAQHDQEPNQSMHDNRPGIAKNMPIQHIPIV